MHRGLVPASRYSRLHDAVTAALARRIEASPTGLLETYPGERYPVDNCAVIASIALHTQLTEGGREALVAGWARRCRTRYVDPASGLLVQAVDGRGNPVDAPRASGTALGLYMLSLGGMELAGDLFRSLQRDCATSFLGFGLVREYLSGHAGNGDIDSGPVVFGVGFSATGFAIGGCRAFGDPEAYRKLYRTAHLVGSPLDAGGTRNYVCGGPLGNAILLAMLTAQPAAGTW
jgi:hypothetical protein